MGSTSKEEQARVRSLLLDTVSLLCKNGLTHKTMKIQGLLGITINDDDVFIVHINDLVGQSETDAGKRTSERSASRESSSGKSSDKNTNRKRSSTSSPASKGPPDKRNREEVIIVDDERRRQMHDNRPIITNIRGGHTPQKHPGMRGPMMGSPNRMPFVRVIGSPNQALPCMPSPQAFASSQLFSPHAAFGAPESSGKIRYRRPADSGERKFKCPAPNCDKSYFSHAARYLHMKRKHSEVPQDEMTPYESETPSTFSSGINMPVFPQLMNVAPRNDVMNYFAENFSHILPIKPEVDAIENNQSESESESRDQGTDIGGECYSVSSNQAFQESHESQGSGKSNENVYDEKENRELFGSSVENNENVPFRKNEEKSLNSSADKENGDNKNGFTKAQDHGKENEATSPYNDFDAQDT